MTATDDRMTIAHHEAGHLVAALLSGVEGVSAELDPADLPGLAGVTRFRLAGNATAPLVQAFVHWCGPYAEHRFTGRSLTDTIRADRCAADRPFFEMFRLHHRNVDADWAAIIDPVWGSVERTAVLLASKQVPVTSTDVLPSAEHVERVLAEYR